VFFSVIDRQEKKWQELVGKYVGVNAHLLSCSASSTNRRVYEYGSRVYKIVTSTEAAYQNTLEEEFALLRKFESNKYVPSAISYDKYDDCSILVLEKLVGEQIGQFGDFVSNKISIFRIIKAFLSLNRLGLRHGDANINNILTLSEGEVKIIDFDQALFVSPFQALLGDFLGIGKYPGKKTVARFVTHILFSRLPQVIRNRVGLKSLLARARASKSERTSEPGQVSSPLLKVWQGAEHSDANAPGVGVSYYSISFGDMVYAGERAWEPRWAAISSVVDFKGKRLLELGCNLSLLSCYAQHLGALEGGIAVDHDERIISAAKEMAVVAGAKLTHNNVDFDSEERWEDKLPVEKFDIVSALSVINWLKDKERFLKFLSQFPEILYEGHDSLTIEVGRLNSAGFYKIKLVSVSERGRTVLLASK